jgi:hypothetical protein
MSALGNRRERPNPPEKLSEKWLSRYETTDKHRCESRYSQQGGNGIVLRAYPKSRFKRFETADTRRYTQMNADEYRYLVILNGLFGLVLSAAC